MTSDWNYGFPKTELVDIYPGEHFELEILFDATNFEFQVKYNGGELSPYYVGTGDYWFGNVSLWGDLYIQYAGFPFLGKSSFSLVYEIKTYDDRDILLQMTTPSLLLARLW